jgi:4-amino-4-deoxy-L-arabinose transferase-like glycosyltransferase
MRVLNILLCLFATLAILLSVLCIIQPEPLTEFLSTAVRSMIIDPQDVANSPQYHERQMDEIATRMRTVGIGLIGMVIGLLAAYPILRRFVVQLPADMHILRNHIAAFYKSVNSGTWFTLFMLTILGAVLRGTYIEQSLRVDEAYNYANYATQPIWLIAANYYEPNNHIFHTILVHLSTQLGSTNALIRLPAFVGGILLIPTTFIFATLLYNKYTGLFAAGIVSVASMIIEYSVNARGYTIQALLFLFAFSAVIYIVRYPNRIAWIAFVIASVLGFYTVPSMLYGFFIIVVWMTLSLYRKKWWGQIISQIIACCVVFGVTILLYTPVHIIYGFSRITNNQFVDPLPLWRFREHLGIFISNIVTLWHRDMPLLFAAVLITGTAVSLLAHNRISKRHIAIHPVAIVCCALLLILQRVVPFERSWLMFIPLYAVFASAGIYAMGRPLLHGRLKPYIYVMVCALFCFLGVWLLVSNGVYLSEETGGTQRNITEVVDFLSTELKSEDAIHWAAPNAALIDVELFRRGSNLDTVPLTQANRIFIIVSSQSTIDELMKQLTWFGNSLVDVGGFTLEQQLHEIDKSVDLNRFSQPRALLSLPWATIYELVKQESI